MTASKTASGVDPEASGTIETFRLDGYVADVLLRDLAGHDRSPAAFLVYIMLWRRTRGRGRRRSSAADNPPRSGSSSRSGARLSHRDIALETGLSKSAVQQALRILHRRGLVKSTRRHQTDTPEHQVMRPWARTK